MSDQYAMFDPTTSGDTGSATSSPASESGVTRSGSQAGKTTAKSGRDHAPASPSAQPGKERRKTTTGIFGQSSFASSKHDDLSFALASRLRPLTDSLGSTLFSLTWTVRVTPAGRSICALRASEPRTEDSVCIGWPTPKLPSGGGMDHRDTPGGGLRKLEDAVQLSAWNTPRATDGSNGGPNQANGAVSADAALTGWGTPAARDWKSGEASQETLDKNARPLNEQAVLSAWGTPKASDGEGGRTTSTQGGGNVHLDKQAKVSGWTSPRPTDDNMSRRSAPAMEAELTRENAGNNLAIDAHLAGWQTPHGPREHDSEVSESTYLGREAQLSGWTTPSATERSGQGPINKSLFQDARMAGWPTPMAQTPAQNGYNEAGNSDSSRKTVEMCRWPNEAQLTAFGDQPIGFLLGPNGWEIVPACGQLSAAHSRWLMGLPPEWDASGVTAMASLRSARRRSSEPTPKQ